MTTSSRTPNWAEDTDVDPQRVEVALEQLCGPAFMRVHSGFDSFDQFLDESPWTVETHDDFEEIPTARFDEYVAEHTTFDTWEAMLSTAGRQWVIEQQE